MPDSQRSKTALRAFLGSRGGRLFLVTWILCSVPFATNIVREHYPAFTIADGFTFKVDRYQGFHPDLFVHTDGHSYVGNNVAVSVIAAIPLFLADPFLDVLERMTPRPDEGGLLADEYRTDKPNRVAFFELVTREGLTLRFGGAAVVTVVLLMAPLTALSVLLMFRIFRRREVEEGRAAWLALLFGFGTPVFFRTLHLNHNLFLMYAIFLAFYLLWFRPAGSPASPGRRVGAGLLAGFSFAADYAGAVLIVGLYAYLVFDRMRETSFQKAFQESLAFVAGTIPPVLFLLYSQWAMYGNPFFPGQYWMPEVNYTDRGWRGFSWPAPDLYWLNLFAPSYGMFLFGPLLLGAVIPSRFTNHQALVARPERIFIWGLAAAFLTFCAANQYSRMQFNSGFRYLAPLVPFLFLLVAEHLVRMKRTHLMVLSAAVIFHSWVLATFREPVFASYRLLFEEGITLPWLRILRMTTPPETPFITSPILPVVIIGITLAVVTWLWRTAAPSDQLFAEQRADG